MRGFEEEVVLRGLVALAKLPARSPEAAWEGPGRLLPGAGFVFENNSVGRVADRR